jgi:hypothetical protein
MKAMEQLGGVKKVEGIEAWMIVYFSAIEGGNAEKAQEAKVRLERLGYEVETAEMVR